MALIEAGRGAFTDGRARRYDLDWLRVIAFGLLIFYHVGMFYVTWDFHVKSVYASPAAELPMLLVNPWRLALLFFISGIAFRYVSDRTPSARLAGRRAWRLGIPIVFGMAVVVAPQTYFEMRQADLAEPGFLAFWGDYLRAADWIPIVTPTWNHLWYVVYLLVYSLLLAPFLPFLRRFASGRGERIVGRLLGGPARVLTIVILPFLVYRFTLDTRFETTHDLAWDWANHAHRFTVFFLGYMVAKSDRFWDAIDRALPWAAGLLVALGVPLSVVWVNWESVTVDAPLALVQVLRGLRIWYAWLAIATLLGFAQRFLNRPSRALSYLTEGVFPYYILHQTVIVAAGYHLTQLRLGVWTEFALVMAATVLTCLLAHELVIRRTPLLRPLFGLRLRGSRRGRGAAVEEQGIPNHSLADSPR